MYSLKESVQVECPVCKDWKDQISHKWYTPATEKRRDHYFNTTKKTKFSHENCPPCYLRILKEEGVTKSELEGLVKKLL